MSAAELFAGMFAACTAVQGLLDVSSPAEVLGRCVFDDSEDWEPIAGGRGRAYDGSTLELQAPLLVILDAGTEAELVAAPNTFRHSGQLIAELYLPSPSDIAIASSTRLRWARSQQTIIRSALYALVGQPGNLARLALSAPRPTFDASLGHFRDCVILPFEGTWS